MTNLSLILVNSGLVISGVVTFFLGLAVYFKGKGKLVNTVFALNTFFFLIFSIAYFLGINEFDPLKSRFYFMFTVVNLFTVATSAHLSFEFIGWGDRYKKFIYAVYTASSLLLVFFVSNPDRFLAPSRKYMYIPNFYVAGSHYWLYLAYFALVCVFFISVLIKKWIKSTGLEKIRVSYFILAITWGYVTGSIGFLPIFSIDANLVYGSFMGLYSIIMSYAILNYELMNIKVVAGRAVNFALFTILAGLLIVAGNWVNDYVSLNILGFPNWLIPLVSSLVVVAIGLLVMRRLREADFLKYEFINNISHKFRTPLTHIRWLAEELRRTSDQKERDTQVQQIQYAAMRLFELTNLVIDVARDQDVETVYSFSTFDVKELINDMIEAHDDQIKNKHLNVKIEYEDNLPNISADKVRLIFAIQILFENSIIYTPEGGHIRLNVVFDNVSKSFIFRIKDNGIGINPADFPNLFKKFFRAATARLADTEGMGIGLFMAKKIIERHNGQIHAYSEGENMGTTFSFTIPQTS